MRSALDSAFDMLSSKNSPTRRSWFARLRLALTTPRKVLVVGINPQSQRLAAQLPNLGYQVLGFIDSEDREVLLKHGRRLADIDSLRDYLRHHVVDEVVLALPSSTWSGPSKKTCEICLEQGITVRLWPHLMSPELEMATIDKIDQHQVLTVSGKKSPR